MCQHKLSHACVPGNLSNLRSSGVCFDDMAFKPFVAGLDSLNNRINARDADNFMHQNVGTLRMLDQIFTARGIARERD